MSLYDELGGAPAVDAAVDIFYRKVLNDNRISHFFNAVDMAGQITKQKAFLTLVFGGPNAYKGKDMFEAHKHMNINEEHFGAVAEQLIATLKELGVVQEKIDSVVEIALSVKGDVTRR